MYAIFHSPTYRQRYAEFLKTDFPRLPLTSKPELFKQLCDLGDRLIELHLMEKPGEDITTYPIEGENIVDKVSYCEPKQEELGKVWINKTQYFEGVPQRVWEFYIGGYQVCDKWLKDRKGRTLSYEDLMHYKNIISAILETIELMNQIDIQIMNNGGFPFQ
jgi:predicted helicase